MPFRSAVSTTSSKSNTSVFFRFKRQQLKACVRHGLHSPFADDRQVKAVVLVWARHFDYGHAVFFLGGFLIQFACAAYTCVGAFHAFHGDDGVLADDAGQPDVQRGHSLGGF